MKRGLYLLFSNGIDKKNIIGIFCFLLIILIGCFTISFSFFSIQEIQGKCPNGYHKSPSGDCEKVIDIKGMPRCPNGYHRSPDGDCELVNTEINQKKIKNNDYDPNNNENIIDFTHTKKDTDDDYNGPLKPNF